MYARHVFYIYAAGEMKKCHTPIYLIIVFLNFKTSVKI